MPPAEAALERQQARPDDARRGLFREGGGWGIRTPEGFHPTRFPSVRHRPLGESSWAPKGRRTFYPVRDGPPDRALRGAVIAVEKVTNKSCVSTRQTMKS